MYHMIYSHVACDWAIYNLCVMCEHSYIYQRWNRRILRILWSKQKPAYLRLMVMHQNLLCVSKQCFAIEISTYSCLCNIRCHLKAWTATFDQTTMSLSMENVGRKKYLSKILLSEPRSLSDSWCGTLICYTNMLH